MPIAYHIYANDGMGGPVDTTSPVATATGLTYNGAPLPAPSDMTFLVRAFDAATGIEESNTQARVRIVTDSAGNDVSGRPNAPHALAARPTAGGGCMVCWAYSPAGQGDPPAGFYVYLTQGRVVSYNLPAATVAYGPALAGYSCTLAGLIDGQAYAVGVRTFNASGTEPNTASTAVLGASTGPSSVEGLSATATVAR